jgi:hypothetical protein
MVIHGYKGTILPSRKKVYITKVKKRAFADTHEKCVNLFKIESLNILNGLKKIVIFPIIGQTVKAK